MDELHPDRQTSELTIVERQAWNQIERQLVADGVTGAAAVVDHQVHTMRRLGLRAAAVGLLVLALGLVLMAAHVESVSLQVTGLGVLVLSVGFGVVVATSLLRVLSGHRMTRA
jgi:Protein of unknown function (DUF3040)